MRRTLLTSLTALAVAAVVFTASAAVLRSSRPPTREPSRVSPKTAEALVARAQAAIAANPRATRAYAALASGSLQRVRETGDPAWYSKADGATRRALALDPVNIEALDDRATLANARHRFQEGLRLARRSAALEPDHFAPLGIAGDALIELGRYDEGFALAAKSLALRPDPSSYSRASYAAELRGDRDRAIELMSLAVESSPPGSEGRAWTRVQLGLLRLGSGDTAGAEREMRTALGERPGDARATAGLARIHAALGRLTDAAARYDRAIETTPLPEYAAALVEIDTARGDRARLRSDVELLDAMERLQEAAGVRVDLDRALIDADLRIPTAADIARARTAYATRPGIVGDQVLGWVLTRAGRCEEGLQYARRSLRLGTRDALLLFHAGAAAQCAGARTQARRWLAASLALNPRFSVRWAPVARTMLKEVSA